ncbi:hypothetical protein HDV03_002855 [Kappamyces sp. JEL0829]|nr:hypothetical protein HDV03_002855 [Kappamyces sp. JEL0829]
MRRTFDEKVQLYKKELTEIQNGTHQGLLQAIHLAEMECEEAIKRAELFYEYQLNCAEHVYQMDCEQSLNDYKNEHDGLQEEMLENLEMKKRKLREDHDNFDLNTDTNYESRSVRKTARLAPKAEETRGTNSRKKAKDKGATLNFPLRENEVADDIAMIRKATGTRSFYKPVKRRF